MSPGSIGGPDEDEWGPIGWVGVFLVMKKLELGASKGFRFCEALPEAAMKFDHELGCALSLYFPLTNDSGRAPRDEDSPGQAYESLACANLASRGFAGRKYDQVGLKVELGNLPGFQETVFSIVLANGEHDLRIHRICIVH